MKLLGLVTCEQFLLLILRSSTKLTNKIYEEKCANGVLDDRDDCFDLL
jgi:hypothetical protein